MEKNRILDFDKEVTITRNTNFNDKAYTNAFLNWLGFLYNLIYMIWKYFF